MILVREMKWGNEAQIQLVEEGKEGQPKSLFIEMCVISHSTKNNNNRMYPEEDLKRAVDNYNKLVVEGNRAWGELGHPDVPVIQPDRIAIKLVKPLVWEGKNAKSKAKVLDTPAGKIAQTLIREGTFGISARGVADVVTQESGIDAVTNYTMIAPDLVADWSNPGSFVEGVMESKEWIWNAEGVLVPKGAIQEAKKAIQKAPKKKRKQVCESAFKKFLQQLRDGKL